MTMLRTLRSYLVGPAVCAVPIGVTLLINGCFHPDADSKTGKNNLGEVRSAFTETETYEETAQVTTTNTETTSYCYCVVPWEGEIFPADDGWETVPFEGGQGPSNVCSGVVFGRTMTGTVQCGDRPW